MPEAQRIWIDVGAHLGEKTFSHAASNPSLRVYAFEPNLAIASQRIGKLPNFVVVPMAIAEENGCANFYLNSFVAASSLLPFHSAGLENWIDGGLLRVEQTVAVPAIRLDTFFERMDIREVEYLKVDAQGADLAVIRSAGARLADIQRISLEVQITPDPLYEGSSDKTSVVEYLHRAGFTLVSTERQSHDQEENLTFERSRNGKS